MAYLSKQFDTISLGWPLGFHALAAIAVLVTEADKLTLRQELCSDTHGVQGKLLAA
jgi:hypothetical protein